MMNVKCWSSVSIRRIIYYFLNVFPFDNTAFTVSGKVGITKRKRKRSDSVL